LRSSSGNWRWERWLAVSGYMLRKRAAQRCIACFQYVQRHKSHDPCFHVFLMEARVMTFVAICTIYSRIWFVQFNWSPPPKKEGSENNFSVPSTMATPLRSYTLILSANVWIMDVFTVVCTFIVTVRDTRRKICRLHIFLYVGGWLAIVGGFFFGINKIIKKRNVIRHFGR